MADLGIGEQHVLPIGSRDLLLLSFLGNGQYNVEFSVYQNGY